jgi:hypothetical protein
VPSRSIGDNVDCDARRLFSFGRNLANPACVAQPSAAKTIALAFSG